MLTPISTRTNSRPPPVTLRVRRFHAQPASISRRGAAPSVGGASFNSCTTCATRLLGTQSAAADLDNLQERFVRGVYWQ